MALFIIFIALSLFQSDAEQLHSFDGQCVNLDQKEMVIATTHGLFDIATGEQRVDKSDAPVDYPEWVEFSPDGQWIVMGDTIHAVETGEMVLSFPGAQVAYAFSDDGKLAHVHGITYDTETWQEIDTEDILDFAPFSRSSGQNYVWRDITSGNGIPTYLSPDGTYWVHILEGIYDVSTGELLELPEHLNNPALLDEGVAFSPDDSLFFVRDDGAYALPSFEKVYDFEAEIGLRERIFVPFSPDSAYFAIANDAIYETQTGKRLIEVSGGAIFSHNNEWVGTGDGLYELATGELLHGGGSFGQFSPDDSLIIVDLMYVFDIETGEKRFDLKKTLWRELYFNADGSLLFGVAFENELLIYDTESGELLHTLPAMASILSTNERFIGLTVDNTCHVYEIER